MKGEEAPLASELQAWLEAHPGWEAKEDDDDDDDSGDDDSDEGDEAGTSGGGKCRESKLSIWQPTKPELGNMFIFLEIINRSHL